MFKDFTKPQKIGKKKSKKLKGEVKLTLTNAETGEVEKVIEGENIVTNAVSDLLDSDNYFGLSDITKLMPIYQHLFGGCLLLKNPFEEVDEKIPRDDDYFIKGQHINPVIAHAGDEIPSDLGDDSTRGFPNTSLVVKNKNAITLAWTWPANLGNGEISAVALTHKDVGNYGIGRASNAFKNMNPYVELQKSSLASTSAFLVGQLDDRTSVAYTLDTSMSPGAKFSFTYYHRVYDKAGLVDSVEPYQLRNTSTVYNSYFSGAKNCVHCFDNDEKVLWLFTQGRTVTNYRFYYLKLPFMLISDPNGDFWGIDFDNIESDSVDVDVANLVDFGVGNDTIAHQKKKVENGFQDIFYFPTGQRITPYRIDVTGVKRLNFQNQADTSEITLNEPLSNSFNVGMCGRYDGDILIISDRVISGLTGYTCKTGMPSYYELSCMQPNEIVSSTLAAKIYLNKFFYSTKFNLKESVNKTSANQMILEYTLREVDEYDES